MVHTCAVVDWLSVLALTTNTSFTYCTHAATPASIGFYLPTFAPITHKNTRTPEHHPPSPEEEGGPCAQMCLTAYSIVSVMQSRGNGSIDGSMPPREGRLREGSVFFS